MAQNIPRYESTFEDAFFVNENGELRVSGRYYFDWEYEPIDEMLFEHVEKEYKTSKKIKDCVVTPPSNLPKDLTVQQGLSYMRERITLFRNFVTCNLTSRDREFHRISESGTGMTYHTYDRTNPLDRYVNEYARRVDNGESKLKFNSILDDYLSVYVKRVYDVPEARRTRFFYNLAEDKSSILNVEYDLTIIKDLFERFQESFTTDSTEE